jgi:holin-like protein
MPVYSVGVLIMLGPLVRDDIGGRRRMLLRGLTWLVLFQLLGTAINHLFLPILPGPIVGLLLLLVFLISRGQVGEPLNLAASSLLRDLPLLLVPPAVGVMVYAKDIAADFWAIVGALVLSLLLSLAFAGVLMQRMVKRHAHREDGQ